MKPIIRLFVFVVLTLVLTFPAHAQIFKSQKDTSNNGQHNFTIQLPTLKSKTRLVPVTEHYKHTVLFGDGTFQFFTSKEIGLTDHTYGMPLSTSIINYPARSYSSGAYSDEEDDVPDMKVVPNIPSSDGVGTSPTVDMVEDNRYVKLTRYVEVKPGDTFVNIVSVKNPDTSSFKGQLLFFYNGRLSAVKKNNKVQLPDYSIFNISDKLFYIPGVIKRTLSFDNLPPSLKNKYGKMLLVEITNLSPGEEVHFFIEMEGDPVMMNFFDATVEAEMNFGVALNVFDPNRPSVVPESLQNELTDLDIGAFVNLIEGEEPEVSPNLVTSYDISGDSTIIENSSVYINPGAVFNIVDYYTSTASLVKSHDPNYMRMESCVCQEEADLYQVFTTIHCENDGYGETSNIYMDVKLPEGIKASDVAIKPISYHPSVSPDDKIRMQIISDDSIRWVLEDFAIEGTPVHGVGNPRTYAEVQFNMYSDRDPALLDSVYACIRFDSLSRKPVYTIPVVVSLVGAELTEGVLTCEVGECADYPPQAVCISWWGWLLLVLLIILLLIMYRRANP